MDGIDHNQTKTRTTVGLGKKSASISVFLCLTLLLHSLPHEGWVLRVHRERGLLVAHSNIHFLVRLGFVQLDSTAAHASCTHQRREDGEQGC